MTLKSIRRRAGKLQKLLRHPAYRRGLKFGVAAAVEHTDVMRSVHFATLIDVGANVGQFSLLTRVLHPSAVIHAFEPLSLMANTFEALFAADVRTTLHRCAAGAAAMTMEINVSNHPDSSSLLPISERQSKLFPGTQKASVEQVDVERVDDRLPIDALQEPILIKLDVQGFELEALKGMPQLLDKASWLYVEVSFLSLYEGQPLADEVCLWLASKGFKLAGVYNPSYSDSGLSVQADMLFVRNAA